MKRVRLKEIRTADVGHIRDPLAGRRGRFARGARRYEPVRTDRGQRQPHGPDTRRGKFVARQTERLDFEAARDAAMKSWENADPKVALIERWGRYFYLVNLPDGDAHFCALGRRDGTLRGFCMCQGFRHHSGPCAHLCTIQKASFIDWEGANDEPIEIPQMVEQRPGPDEESTPPPDQIALRVPWELAPREPTEILMKIREGWGETWQGHARTGRRTNLFLPLCI